MPKILVVDDIETNRKLLRGILAENEDYTVIEVDSGKEALKAIKKDAPDIILLDIMMPEMDGLEVCRKLKEDEEYRGIPILFITAMAETEEKVKGLESGGADYITKPINQLEVMARVKAHLRIKEAEAERLQAKGLKTVKDMIITYNHEMNQPLTAIHGYVELMMSDVGKDDENYDTLKTIKEQAQRVTKILEKIKSLDKIETKEYISGKNMIDLKLDDGDAE